MLKYESDLIHVVSLAFEVIIIANSSSVPAMPSANATQASFPEEIIIPFNQYTCAFNYANFILPILF